MDVPEYLADVSASLMLIYLGAVSRWHPFLFHCQVKSINNLRTQLLPSLSFLFQAGSITGYLKREDILCVLPGSMS
jgi:hypothetical protein